MDFEELLSKMLRDADSTDVPRCIPKNMVKLYIAFDYITNNRTKIENTKSRVLMNTIEYRYECIVHVLYHLKKALKERPKSPKALRDACDQTIQGLDIILNYVRYYPIRTLSGDDILHNKKIIMDILHECITDFYCVNWIHKLSKNTSHPLHVLESCFKSWVKEMNDKIRDMNEWECITDSMYAHPLLPSPDDFTIITEKDKPKSYLDAAKCTMHNINGRPVSFDSTFKIR